MVPHEIKDLYLPFQSLWHFCLLSICTERLFPSTSQPIYHHCSFQEDTSCKNSHLQGAPTKQMQKHFTILSQAYAMPFAMGHGWEWWQKLPSYLLPTAWTFLLLHVLHSVQTLYWRGGERRREEVVGTTYLHSFSHNRGHYPQAQFLGSMIINKQQQQAKTGFLIQAVRTESLSSTVQISHTLVSCSPSSPVPWKGHSQCPQHPALPGSHSPAPTHCMGADKAPWAAGNLEQTPALMCPRCCQGLFPAEWVSGAPALTVKKHKHADRPCKVIQSSPVSTLLLGGWRSLPYTRSADRLQTSSQGQRSCRCCRMVTGRATSLKRRRVVPLHHIAMGAGTRVSELFLESTVSQFCNSMNNFAKVKKKCSSTCQQKAT